MRKLMTIFLLLAGMTSSAQETKIDPITGEEIEDTTQMEMGEASAAGFIGDIRSMTLETFRSGPINLDPIDTGLTDLHQYIPVLRGTPHMYLGNLGSPHEPLIFDPFSDITFDLGQHQYDGYILTNSDIRFYRNTTPMSELYYVQGPKEEQYFRALHSQNLGRGMNVGFDYKRLASEGFYNRQKTDGRNFAAFTWIQSRNERYNLFADIRFDRLEMQENGGVTDAGFFDDDSLDISRDVVPVNLTNAQTTWVRRTGRIHQSFDLGNRWTHALTDTTDTTGLSPGLRFGHTFTFSDGHYLYEDIQPMVGYYRDVFYDGTKTHDSLRFLTMKHEFDIMSSGVKRKDFDTTVYSGSIWRIGGMFEQWELTQQPVEQISIDTSIYNVGLFAAWNNNVLSGKRFLYGFEANYIVAGRNEGDQKGMAFLGYRLSDNWDLKAEAKVQQREPHYQAWIYESNHYSWRNNYTDKELIASVALKLTDNSRGAGIDASLYQLDNFVFYDTTTLPLVASAFTGLVIRASKEFKFGKFRLWNELTYQGFDGGPISAPEFMGRQSFYFASPLFKSALLLNTGIDTWYATDFTADAFMPVTGKFVNNARELEFYPVIDAFVNVRIKRIRVFMKMSHLSQGWFGKKGYFASPFYPMPDRGFRLGLSWMFFD